MKTLRYAPKALLRMSIKIIALSALLVAGICQTSIMHAHPLEKLMPFVTRILWNSESLLSSVQGLWIKKLAEPYGLKCQYPVLVKKDPFLESASAFVTGKEENGVPTVDHLNRVPLDADENDTKFFTAQKKGIIFNHNFAQEFLHYGNHKGLIAVLFHEHEHLERRHSIKTHALQTKIDYARKNGLAMTLNNQPFEQDPQDYLLCINRTHERQSDASMRRHRDLCLNQADYFNSLIHLSEDEFSIAYSTAQCTPSDLQDVMQQAMKGSLQAQETLQQKSMHPLNRFRALQFKQWAEEADTKK